MIFNSTLIWLPLNIPHPPDPIHLVASLFLQLVKSCVSNAASACIDVGRVDRPLTESGVWIYLSIRLLYGQAHPVHMMSLMDQFCFPCASPRLIINLAPSHRKPCRRTTIARGSSESRFIHLFELLADFAPSLVLWRSEFIDPLRDVGKLIQNESRYPSRHLKDRELRVVEPNYSTFMQHFPLGNVDFKNVGKSSASVRAFQGIMIVCSIIRISLPLRYRIRHGLRFWIGVPTA